MQYLLYAHNSVIRALCPRRRRHSPTLLGSQMIWPIPQRTQQIVQIITSKLVLNGYLSRIMKMIILATTNGLSLAKNRRVQKI